MKYARKFADKKGKFPSISTTLILLALLLSQRSLALVTEVGLTYGRKTTSFDANNYFDSESVSGSLSFYFFERLALEASYTESKAIRQEKASSTDPKRVVVQTNRVMGADLILVFADRKSFFQPYIKGGTASLTRKQEVQVEGFATQTLEPESAIIPSYGAGIKLSLSSDFSIRFSYDVWQTPIGGGLKTDDSSLRAGLTWLL